MVIINIILVGVSIDYTIKYTNSQKYNKLKCNITKIEYPTEIPNTIDEYNNNFVKCSCGKRCTSDMGICTKLFITNKNLEEVLLQKKYGIYDSECTFAETKCENGEIIEDRINAIQENIDYIRPKNEFENSSKSVLRDVDYKKGQLVHHSLFGKGKILDVEGEGNESKLSVVFNGNVRKKLITLDDLDRGFKKVNKREAHDNKVSYVNMYT